MTRPFEAFEPGTVRVGEAGYEIYDAGDRHGPALAVNTPGPDNGLVFLGADPESMLNFAEAVRCWADDYVMWADSQGPGS